MTGLEQRDKILVSIALGFFLLWMLICAAMPAYASNIQIEVDGVTITSEVASEIKNNRTMVPLRVISENLGTVVNWSNSEVILSNRNVQVLLKLNNAEAVKNGTTLLLDVKPYLKNNRIMVPLRFIAEAFSCEVNYKNFIVTVDTKSQDEKISARYWLGDAEEKTVEYGLRTNKEGDADLLNDKDETILSGFTEYNLMLNLIFAKKEGKWGLYHKTGQMIVEHMYEEISNYEMPNGNKANGLVGVKKNGLWGAIDQEGNIVIRPEFEYVELNYYEEVEPFIKVKKNGKFGYLTREGQPLVDIVWDTAFMDVLNVPEDLIFVKQGEKWGGIRVDGNKAAPVDWNLIPSEEAQLSFNNWKYAHQGSFYCQQIRDGKTDISINTKRFFNDYFRTNSMELRCLPVFTWGKNPKWDDLTLFVLLSTPHPWSNGSMPKEQFAEVVTKYFGDISYTHKSSEYLKYQDDMYTAVGLSFHGFYIYELKNLEKGKTVDGKNSWKAQITGYYFHELDGDPNDSSSSKNAQAVYQEMKKDEYHGLNFWQACDRLVWNNPGSVLAPAVEWKIDFIVKDPLGDIYFTYLSCEKKSFI